MVGHKLMMLNEIWAFSGGNLSSILFLAMKHLQI